MEKIKEDKIQWQWQPVIELVIVLATIVGTTVPLYIHTDGKLDEYAKFTAEIIRDIQKEMKEFHGKMERQDAEFKGKLALQDAEFKAHILHTHQEK